MFKLKNVNIIRGKIRLLTQINTNFRSNQLCILIGPNGAGKSTLLKTLTKDVLIDSGEIYLHHKNILSWKNQALSQVRAVLPQKSSTNFPFIAYDIIAMGRLPHDDTTKKTKYIIDEVSELCGCQSLLNRLFSKLSGGEQQLIQIARTLVQIYESEQHTERFLLLDEPITALDLKYQYQLLSLFKKLVKQKGFGIICVLHDLNLATQFAQRCILLSKGKIEADGTPQEVFTPKKLSRVFETEIHIHPHPESPSVSMVLPKLQH